MERVVTHVCRIYNGIIIPRREQVKRLNPGYLKKNIAFRDVTPHSLEEVAVVSDDELSPSSGLYCARYSPIL
jgi:hypothetical protein